MFYDFALCLYCAKVELGSVFLQDNIEINEEDTLFSYNATVGFQETWKVSIGRNVVSGFSYSPC